MKIKGILIVLTSLASLAWLLTRITIGRSGGETITWASVDQGVPAGVSTGSTSCICISHTDANRAIRLKSAGDFHPCYLD
jgi:hypothetical protein